MLTYREIEEADAKTLLDWRTSPRIAKGFHQKVIYDIDRQRQWIQDMRNFSDGYHWIVSNNGKDIAYARFHHWDIENGSCRLGMYVGSLEDTLAFPLIKDDFLYFLFNSLDLNQVMGWVLPDNDNSNKFVTTYGYKRRFDMDEMALKEMGYPVNVYVLEKDSWSPRMRGGGADFPTTLWHGKPAGII